MPSGANGYLQHFIDASVVMAVATGNKLVATERLVGGQPRAPSTSASSFADGPFAESCRSGLFWW